MLKPFITNRVISTTSFVLHVAATCTFQDGICGYTQDTTDSNNFDWSRGSGATITPNTGPAADHTLGSAAGMLSRILMTLTRPDMSRIER